LSKEKLKIAEQKAKLAQGGVEKSHLTIESLNKELAALKKEKSFKLGWLPKLSVAGAVVGIGLGLRGLDADEIPKTGVLSAAFFMASLIHVPIPPASAHLLLNGLLGLLLGWRAFPALAAALLLQVLLFGFGGYTSLGANLLIMGIPAVSCHALYARFLRPDSPRATVFRTGFMAGITGVLLTCVLGTAVLVLTGSEFTGFAAALAIAHVPVMIIEGFVTGSATVFLHGVRPGRFFASNDVPNGNRKAQE